MLIWKKHTGFYLQHNGGAVLSLKKNWEKSCWHLVFSPEKTKLKHIATLKPSFEIKKKCHVLVIHSKSRDHFENFPFK